VRLVTFAEPGAGARVGALVEGGVLDLGVVPAAPRDLVGLLGAEPDVLAAARAAVADPNPAAVLPRDAVRLLAPVPPTRRRSTCPPGSTAS
jgi:hypothetical protein